MLTCGHGGRTLVVGAGRPGDRSSFAALLGSADRPHSGFVARCSSRRLVGDQKVPFRRLSVCGAAIGHDEIRMLERRGRNPNKGLSRARSSIPGFHSLWANCLVASCPGGGKLVVR